jgi:hypothetical protein
VQINIKIGMDQLFLDQVPDDAGHLIAIKFHDGIGDFYLGHYGSLMNGAGIWRCYSRRIVDVQPLCQCKAPMKGRIYF